MTTRAQQLQWPDAADNEHVAFVGRTGSGKTFAAKGRVEHALEAGRRVCIVDPTGVWWGLRSLADGRPGLPVTIFGGEHGDIPIGKATGANLAKLLAGQNLPCVVDLSELLIGERHVFMEHFLAELYRRNRAPLHLVVDEADEFAPQRPLPETRRMLHHFDRIVRRGRVRGFRVTMISQRPAVLHKDVLTQAATLVALQLTGPQDRDAIKAWIAGQADADVGKDVIASLPRLKKGEGWLWAPALGVLERGFFPMIRTFDSSRGPEHHDEGALPVLAEVDLEAIRTEFSEAEDMARKNDPRVLRKRIADLEAQLRAAAPGVAEAEVRKREAVAFNDGRATGRKEVIWAIEDAVSEFGDTKGGGAPAAQERPKSAGGAGSPAPPAPGTMDANCTPIARQTAGALSRPQQRVLDALAWFHAIGITAPSKIACAFVAGYKAGSGTINNLYGQLRAQGLVEYPAGGDVALTEAGRAAASYPAETPTTAELQELVKRKLPTPLARVLDEAINVYPDSISKTELAARSGYTPGAGTFNNYCGRLRGLGLIEYPAAGQARACDILFLEGGSHE